MALREVFQAIAAKSFTVSGTSIRSFDIDATPGSIETSMLPCRLLLLPGRTEGRNTEFITLNKGAKTTWNIADLMLWSPVTLGAGLHTVAPLLVEYMSAYREMMRQSRAISDNCLIVGARFTPGTTEWPADSGKRYFSVLCEVIVEEFTLS